MDQRKSTIDILGIPVDNVTMGDALSAFDGFLSGASMAWIATPNAEIVSQAAGDSSLAQLLMSADLVIPDGVGLLYASRMLGRPLRERVAGIDFAHCALKRCAANGVGVYFLGGRPGISEQAAAKKMRDIPGLRIAGTHHGYFEQSDTASIVEAINESGAGFLCVALGFPKQERFLLENKNALHIKAGIGIGGSFDVWAGALKRAPKVFRSVGLEWLYRLGQEPSRIKRIATLPLFLVRVAAQKVSGA